MTHTSEAQLATLERASAFDFNIHTALVLWEALDQLSRHPGPAQELRDNVGAAELRDLCIGLTDHVEHIYRIANEGYALDHISFDWDFVPWLLSTFDWSDTPLPNLLPAETMAARALEAFPRIP